MLSGTFMISCITVPAFANRCCSLLFAAQRVAVRSVRQTTNIDLRSIADLHDQNFGSGDFFSPELFPARGKTIGKTGAGAITIPYFGTLNDLMRGVCLLWHTFPLWFQVRWTGPQHRIELAGANNEAIGGRAYVVK